MGKYIGTTGLEYLWEKLKAIFYQKPSSGIPSSDMSSAVQTSLGKADTALQSFTETDPTVPAWAKASTKPTYTAAEVGALPDTTVIPAAQIQVDWNETDPTNIAYIQNAPLDVKKWDYTGAGIGYGIKIDNTHVSINGGNHFYVGNSTSTGNSISWDTAGDVGLTLVSDSEGMVLRSGAGVSLTTTGNNKFYYNNKEVAVKDDIPAAQVNSDWNATSGVAQILNKPAIPSTYAASATAGGAALKTGSIPFGVVDSTSTATVFTATVPGITELTDGTCVLLKNGVVTSTTNFTININGLGAHHAFNNMTAATAETTIFNINYTMLFVYDSTRVVGGITGAWCCYRGYDANTNTIGYQIRANSASLPCSDRARYYKIYFTSADGTMWVPASSDWANNAAAAKVVNQRPINPFGPIVYTSANTNYTAGTLLAAASIWQQYALTLGHSFNWTGAALTLTTSKPVYVKCAPQSDGSAIMDSTTPIVQDLPSTEDGKIYIFLGIAYNATSIELRLEHPVFYYKDSAIRLWTNTAASSTVTVGTLNTNNSTAQTVNSSESFSGTINLHKVSKTGSYNDLLNKPTIPAADTAITNNEIDTIWTNAMADAITFTINGDTYQADAGMTWQQWVNSNYNVVANPYTGNGAVNNGNFYIEYGIIRLKIGYMQNPRVCNPGSSTNEVSPQDIINADYAYELTTANEQPD